jgi:hypothetical protein
MARIVSLMTIWAGFCSLGAGPSGAAGPGDPPEDSDSRYEQVELLDHSRYFGLIESVDDNWLTLIRIQSPRGRQMNLVIQPFDRRQVASFSRLDAGKRAALAQQIEEFRNRATIEAANMEAIRLEPWEAEGNSYRHYRGKWFTLDSTADEQNTRRVIVRAEQVFAAYRQIVPPRCMPPQPPRLVVLESMDQYQAVLSKLGLKMRIQNPACFLEDQNVVVIGSDLARLAAVTSQVAAQNAQLRRDLRDLDGRLAEHLRVVADNLRKSDLSNGEIAREVTREREKFKKQLEKKRDELRLSDQQIDHLFKKNTSQTLARLYHEAFHAYLRNNVYPRQQYDVPPWLNEGLAVIFEGGQLEGNRLRVDAPNPLALKKLKADLAGPGPLELEKLLAAGEGQFLVVAGVRPAAVDRYYVHAWGLAYYLTFEKHLLGSPALEKYLRSDSPRLAPAQRFQQLVGIPLAQFEKEWRAYIQSL